jgi:hypothetical protein
MLCVTYYCLFIFFNRLEKSKEQFLHGSEGGGEEKGGAGAWARNGNFIHPSRKMKSYHLQVNGWNWRTLF